MGWRVLHNSCLIISSFQESIFSIFLYFLGTSSVRWSVSSSLFSGRMIFFELNVLKMKNSISCWIWLTYCCFYSFILRNLFMLLYLDGTLVLIYIIVPFGFLYAKSIIFLFFQGICRTIGQLRRLIRYFGCPI